MSYEFDEYKVNEPDVAGRIIERILDREESRYIIYFVVNDFINALFTCSDEFDIEFGEEFETLLSKIDEQRIDNIKAYSFIRIGVAEALKKELRGHNNEAVRILSNTLERAINQKRSDSFIWYCGIFSVPLVILSILVMTNIFKLQIWLLLIMKCIVFSGLGSLLNSLQNQDVQLSDFRGFIIKKSVLDFLKSAIGGLLIYIIIASNLMLGNFGGNNAAILVLCFVSGYSNDIPILIVEKIKKMVTE